MDNYYLTQYNDLSNYQQWLKYTAESPSPQLYLDWAWIFTISAALQRRVWIGGDDADGENTFPNIYVFLVGPPAVGKGTAIRPASKLLSKWEKKDFIQDMSKFDEAAKIVAQTTIDSDNEKLIKVEQQAAGKDEIFQPKLFPDAGDATTYEALVKGVAESYRRINYIYYCHKRQKDSPGIYGHSSMYFCLPELSSLLRKRTEDTVNYLIGLYDCPPEYKYITKTQGRDRVRRGCISILAGTQPSFIQAAFDDRLTNEGFSSRIFFVYSADNSKSGFFINAHKDEHREAETTLLNHIRKLAALYGAVHIDEADRHWLSAWYKDFIGTRAKRANGNPVLDGYYSRMQRHIQKLAMCLHFGESTDMHIKLETFERVIKFLAGTEKTMHFALVTEAQNPQMRVARAIMELLSTGAKNWVDIYGACYKILDKRGIEESLEFLFETGQIASSSEKDEDTGKVTIYWRLRQ